MRRFLPLLLAFALAAPVAAFQLTPLDEKQIVVELTTKAESRDAAVAAAKREAVLGSAGRVLQSEHLILADSLLVKYLGNYAGNFVTAVEPISEKFQAGETELTSRVYVDYGKLQTDLGEKKFLYKPAYKPRFTAFMTERLDGRISNEGKGRELLAVALNNLGMRRYTGEITTPPSTTDVSADEFLLERAVVSAQRSGVEVILTGEVKTTLRDQKKLYFDEYWFYDTEIVAKLIRVDTGVVLMEAKASGSASDKEPGKAIETSMQKAAARVADHLVTDFDKLWPVLVQGKGDYQILLTGANAETVGIVEQNIKRLGRETEVYVRKSFDKSAVLSVVYKGSKEDVLEVLKSCPFPTLYIINPESDRMFEVQVSG